MEWNVILNKEDVICKNKFKHLFCVRVTEVYKEAML